MLHFKNSKLTATVLLMLVPVLFFFQNCSQQGSINLKGAALNSATTTSGATSVGDGLVIDPNTSAPQSSVDLPNPAPVPSPMPGSDSSKGTVAASGDHSSGQTSHHDNDDKDNGSKCDSNHSDMQKCDGLEISDLLLNIDSVNAGSSICAMKKDAVFEIVDKDKTISLNKLSLKIKALKKVDVKQLFLGLNASGNKVLSSDDKVMNLSTPSGQTSGLKVQLDSTVLVEVGIVYSLELSIDPNDQIVDNPNRCIFRPVIKSAKLVSE